MLITYTNSQLATTCRAVGWRRFCPSIRGVLHLTNGEIGFGNPLQGMRSNGTFVSTTEKALRRELAQRGIDLGKLSAEERAQLHIEIEGKLTAI